MFDEKIKKEFPGLSEAAAEKSLKEYGENVIYHKERLHPIVVFLKKFNRESFSRSTTVYPRPNSTTPPAPPAPSWLFATTPTPPVPSPTQASKTSPLT